ncbi:MAG: penicillin-binding protein 1B [Cellvibrionaceae bacterium]
MSRAKKSRSKKSPPSFFRTLWRWLRWPLVLGVLIGLGWVVYLDIEVRSKFDGRKWALPARVYAQPMELYVGRRLLIEDIVEELTALDYQSVSRVSRAGQWRRQGNSIEIYTRQFQRGGVTEPSRHVRLQLQNRLLTGLTVVRGKAARILVLEPALIGGIYPRRQEDRDLIQLSQVPPLLGEALIAVEDRNFVNHWGVSPKAIARAAWVNLQSGRVVQGGSTLTQQLVKNFFLTDSRKLSRKITEAVMSVLLEVHYSKSEILETYMNEVYLGQSGPRQIHGFGLASKHYFGTPLASLDASQIALLVGVVKGASYYNPWRNPARALERRNLVLDVLAQQRLLSVEESRQAKRQPLNIVSSKARRLSEFPAFIDLVKRQLREDYSDEELSSEGLNIYTTLSLSIQRKAEKALAQRLTDLERRHGLTAEPLQGAVMMTAVGSGEVVAVVGDRNAKFAGFNRALDASRPIGSLVKPAVYLAALESDHAYHLSSPVSDGAVTVAGPDGERWQPRNFDRQSHGEVLLIDALSRSYNQATARLGMTVGLEAVAATLKQLGVDKNIPQVPSLLLGTLELSPAQVSTFYHSIANDGVVMPLRSIRSVETAAGEPLNRYPLTLSEPVKPQSVELIQYALQSVMEEGTGRSAYQLLPRDLALGGKTGTTNDQRDSWFAGFSGQHLGVVWIGRDDNGATPLTGGGGALKVWADIYSQLATQGLDILPSAEVEYLWVDRTTGLRSGENCRNARLVPFHQHRPVQKAPCEWVENPVLHWMKKWF